MGNSMEINSFDRIKIIKTALKEAGLSIEDIKKKGKRIVVTISHRENPLLKIDRFNNQYIKQE